jgi:hypothetical protein
MRPTLALLTLTLGTPAVGQGFLGTIAPPPAGMVGQSASAPGCAYPIASPGCGASGPAPQVVIQPLPEEADSFKSQRRGKEVGTAVRSLLRKLDWHEELEDAAAAAIANGKPILWIQALGELDGFT